METEICYSLCGCLLRRPNYLKEYREDESVVKTRLQLGIVIATSGQRDMRWGSGHQLFVFNFCIKCSLYREDVSSSVDLEQKAQFSLRDCY